MYSILENNKFTNKKDSHAKLQALWLEAHYQVRCQGNIYLQGVPEKVALYFEISTEIATIL